MNENYIRSLPGMVKGADNADTDLLKLLHLEGSVPQLPEQLHRGFTSPPVAALRIGDKHYDAASLLGVVGDSLDSAVLERTATLTPDGTVAVGDALVLDNALPRAAMSVVSTIPTASNASGALRSLQLVQQGRNLLELDTVTFTQHKEFVLQRPIPPGTYYLTCRQIETTDTDDTICNAYFDGTGMHVNWTPVRNRRTGALLTFPSAVTKVQLYAANSFLTGAGDVATYNDLHLEFGNSMPDYEPYHETVYEVDFGGPVYGGSYDWATGVLTVTHDLENGAVKKLSRARTVQLTPQPIPLHRGRNVLRCSTPTSATYAIRAKDYIDEKFSTLETAILAMGANI